MPEVSPTYPFWATDTIRYCDTDRQGHVNNAIFAQFLETGRVHLLLDPDRSLIEPGANIVIVRLVLDFKAEIRWPGEVRVGTRIASAGRSSMTLQQEIFQADRSAATAESVIVQVDAASGKSRPFSATMAARIAALIDAG